MLAVDPVLGHTRLSWLGTGPVSATPAAVKDELEKLAFLRRMDAHTLDLSVLPAERRRFLAGLGRRLTAQNLARREPARRYPILLTLVAQSAVDVLDEVLLLFDQALSGRESAARERLTEVLAERARRGEDRDDLLRVAAASSRPCTWTFRRSPSTASSVPSPGRPWSAECSPSDRGAWPNAVSGTADSRPSAWLKHGLSRRVAGRRGGGHRVGSGGVGRSSDSGSCR